MSEIPLEMLAHDARVFDLAHGMVEKRLPVLGVAHELLDQSLTQVELSLEARIAVGIGIRTFELVSGPDLATDVMVVEVIRYATQIEKTGNFVLQLLEDMQEAAYRLPDTAPELAEASDRIVTAHLSHPTPELVWHARSGAGIMHGVFSEAYLSTILGDNY